MFAVFYEPNWIATVTPTVKLTAAEFRRERASLVRGWIFVGHQLGAAAIAFIARFSRTALECYLPAFFLAGAFCLIVAGLVLTLTGPSKSSAPAYEPKLT